MSDDKLSWKIDDVEASLSKRLDKLEAQVDKLESNNKQLAELVHGLVLLLAAQNPNSKEEVRLCEEIKDFFNYTDHRNWALLETARLAMHLLDKEGDFRWEIEKQTYSTSFLSYCDERGVLKESLKDYLRIKVQDSDS